MIRVSCIVSAYHKPNQLLRLLGALEAPETRIHLHVDRRSPRAVHQRVRDGLAGRVDVELLPPHRCWWGSFGHVAASLKGMRAAVDARSDWAVLLTGQDYPVKPRNRLNEFLAVHDGEGFLDPTLLPMPGWAQDGGFDRFRFRHFPAVSPRARIAGRLLPTPRPREFYPGLTPYGDSSYWCLHIDLVRYVLDFIDRRPDVIRYFRTVHVPDEMFFHSILGSSGERDRLVTGNDLHYIRWSSAGKSPDILTSDDLPALAETSKFFARKFDSARDEEVLDTIDATLLGADRYRAA